MPDDTHDMRLLAFVVDGVAQRLAVDGERLVVPAVLLVPALQRAVELFGVDADQEGTDGGLARGLADPIAQPDPEPFEGFVPERIDPFPNRLVAACAAQRRGGRKREGAGQGMAPPLAGARSSISVKNSGSERIWAALSMVCGAPLCRVGSSVAPDNCRRALRAKG